MYRLCLRTRARALSGAAPLLMSLVGCSGEPDTAGPGSGPSDTGSVPGGGDIATDPVTGEPLPGGQLPGGQLPGGATSGALGTVTILNAQDKAIARLTRSQFLRSAAALVGEQPTLGVDALLPELDIQGGLFRNTGFAQEQLYSVVQGYDAATTAIVDNITDWPTFHSRWGGCTDFSCAQTFLSSFVEAAFRRPVTAAEIAQFQPILDAGVANLLSYDDTIGLVIRAVLQAPEFLYLFFDATLNDFQLAARLSYLITDGPPDLELYGAAQSQLLSTPEGLTAQVDRLLAGGISAFARAFGFDYWDLRKAPTRNINATETSTVADPALIQELINSAVDSFTALADANAPIGAMLTTETFVASDAAASWLAGVPSTGGTVTPTARYPFMGLLTHPATLISISNAVFGSTVSRGQFIANQLLCVPPTPPPPPGALTTDLSALLPPNPTARDHGEARIAEPRCAVCHAQFESYSFALNKWGGDGLFKDDPLLLDNGPIQTGLGNVSFDSYRDFLPQLAASTQFQRCVTDHVIRYGLQHTEYPSEVLQAVIDEAQRASPELTFRSMIKALVVQPIFRTR